MTLFQLKNADVELWIMAERIIDAISKWQERIAYLEGGAVENVEMPTSIIEMADEEDVVLHYDHDEVVNNLRIELGHAKTERNNRTADLVKVEKVLDRLQDLKSSLMNALGISHNMTDPMEGVDEKILAEIGSLKAQASAYQTYIEAKAGQKATPNAVKMAKLQHEVSMLTTALKMANDKLDAKEGHDVP